MAIGQVVESGHIPVRVGNCASLAGQEAGLVQEARHPVHLDQVLDVLLFGETLL